MSNFSAISWQEQVPFGRDDEDDVHFVLDEHTSSASSLKQQYVGRHVNPLRHIILIPSQQIFVLIP